MRLHKARYVETGQWQNLDQGDRHLLAMKAVASAARECAPLFSRESAALLWRLPIGVLPETVQVNIPPGSGQRSHGLVRRRLFPCLEDGGDLIEGLSVTGKIQTAVELTISQSFPWAIAAMDRLLGDGAKVEEVRVAILRMPTRPGPRKPSMVLELASAQSMSVGESISRANINLAGLPAPSLQRCFLDGHGLIGFTDFYWEEFGLVGEFDGRMKYRKDEYLRGRDPAEVVIAEKEREDRLRALGLKVTRWTWETAISSEKLRAHLLQAGLRPVGSSQNRRSR